MTVLGTDPVPRLPALARRAVEAAGRARLAEALECATRWLDLVGRLCADRLEAVRPDDALRVLGVLVQVDRHREARTLSELARRAPGAPDAVRASLDLFEDATDVFNGVRPWQQVPSTRLALDPPVTTGTELDVVHAAVRSAWTSLDDDDPERALAHTTAAAEVVPRPASWPILVLPHVVALVTCGELAELARLRATLLDGEHWISRVRTHPAFLSARVAVAEMTMRTWLEEEPSVRTKGAPPEARDRVRAVRVATTGGARSRRPLDLDRMPAQSRRARHGTLLAEAMRRAREGDDAGALETLRAACGEEGCASLFPVALAVAPWRNVERLLALAETLPPDDPGRRVLAVTGYPLHRRHAG
ncbi:hypothetical protein [Salana multivorans]|mgnify:CR=1 FL=1|uniref:hypothetical protein n=1 Tax=Salana multivorans TaxID=120377 RepID=UPI000A5579FD|nr:hypothetical protein [Salana multivorans]